MFLAHLLESEEHTCKGPVVGVYTCQMLGLQGEAEGLVSRPAAQLNAVQP